MLKSREFPSEKNSYVQYTEKFDNLNTELIKTDNKIKILLKETKRTERIKLRLNKFKSLFKRYRYNAKIW